MVSLKSGKKKKEASKLMLETRGYAAYSFIVSERKYWGLYPPARVIRDIEASGLPCFMVLHRHDTNSFGFRKFLHYHVMVLFDESREAMPVFELCEALGGVSLAPCYSPYASARYLCHLDNPDKYQYNPKNVECINGCNYEEFIKIKED